MTSFSVTNLINANTQPCPKPAHPPQIHHLSLSRFGLRFNTVSHNIFYSWDRTDKTLKTTAIKKINFLFRNNTLSTRCRFFTLHPSTSGPDNGGPQSKRTVTNYRCFRLSVVSWILRSVNWGDNLESVIWLNSRLRSLFEWSLRCFGHTASTALHSFTLVMVKRTKKHCVTTSCPSSSTPCSYPPWISPLSLSATATAKRRRVTETEHCTIRSPTRLLISLPVKRCHGLILPMCVWR